MGTPIGASGHARACPVGQKLSRTNIYYPDTLHLRYEDHEVYPGGTFKIHFYKVKIEIFEFSRPYFFDLVGATLPIMVLPKHFGHN